MINYHKLKKILVGKTVKKVVIGGYNNEEDCILDIHFKDNSILELGGDDDGNCIMIDYKSANSENI